MARINRNKVMETARRAKDKGQFDKAIREYQKVVAEDPSDVRVLLKIGDLFAQKGSKNEATDTYTRVARLYKEQGFYLKSVAVYKQILKLDPRLVEINLQLAELYRQLGLLSDAMQHFEMVAAFFHREGKTREALATLRQLVELDPDNVATRIKLAELYSKEEMKDEAIAEFGKACEFLRSHNRLDDFVKVAERLLWHNQEDIALNKELATLYLHRNDPRRALQKLQVCFKADGRDVDTLALLAQAFQALDQRGKTVSVLKELARVLSEEGKSHEAEEVHRKILSFVPDDPDSLQAVGAQPAAAIPATQEFEVGDEMIVDEPRGDFRHPMGNPTGSMPLLEQPPPSYAEPAYSEPAYSGPEFGGDVTFGTSQTSVDSEAGFAAEFDLVDEPSYHSSVRGEANSDEIVKVLTETDVYVKYGLHQKAIEHLHRVFELDPDNLEARERLKDIFFSLGRQREGISQLIHLATVVAPREPGRAEGYLRSVVEYDGSHAEAHALASRYRINLGENTDLEVADEGLDFSPRDSSPDLRAEPEPAIGYPAGSPLPAQSPAPTPDSEAAYSPNLSYGSNAPMTLDGDVDEPVYGLGPDLPGQDVAGQEVVVEQDLNQDLNQDYELDLSSDDIPVYDEPMAVGSAEPMPSIHEDVAEMSESDSDIYTLSEDDLILEDGALEGDGVTMEVSLEQVEREIARAESEAALDLNDHAFAVPPLSSGGPLSDEAADLTPVETVAPYQPALATGDSPFPVDQNDEFIEGATIADPAGDGPGSARPDDVTVDVPIDAIDAAIAAQRGESRETAPPALEDDLDEADFFISQGLLDEAREILNAASERYPMHPLVLAKVAEVEAHASGGFDPVVGHDPTIQAKPSVLLERPVDDEDADTHFDLGLAYKDMGLHGEAIKAFNKVIHVAGRAVQCYLMLGLCHREMGELSEAITQFKAGLYVDQISTAEKYGLYYEIGSTYERLEDPQEALYYYEMIVKKQPDYRDVSERVASLRERYPAKTGTSP